MENNLQENNVNINITNNEENTAISVRNKNDKEKSGISYGAVGGTCDRNNIPDDFYFDRRV